MTLPKIKHIPVMLDEVIEGLSLKHNGIYVDCTLGLGGHSKKILESIGVNGKLIGIDCDFDALTMAKDNLAQFVDRCEYVHDNYRHIDTILDSLGIKFVDGILLDLGISSFQLDDVQRGFSIKTNGPLDMRMNQNANISAFDLINSLSENEISMILKDYGQERWHYRISRAIVKYRSQKPIETTKELRHIVMRTIPSTRKWQKIHPATRTFQAIRIAVNRELESLELVLDKCLKYLNTGGRLCVLSFHSLEDGIVKHKFRKMFRNREINILTKKPLRPTEEEASINKRARSARLRILERI